MDLGKRKFGMIRSRPQKQFLYGPDGIKKSKKDMSAMDSGFLVYFTTKLRNMKLFLSLIYQRLPEGMPIGSQSWNVRGLGNPRAVRGLRHMLTVHRPRMVFLMEIKLDGR